MEIIRDLLWLWILGAVGGTGYILWAVFVRDAAPAPVPAGNRPPQQITTRRTPGAPPVARPAGAPPVATPPVATPPARSATPMPAPGSGEHQRRGSAPTVKLPLAEPAKPQEDEDKAAADLFGGLSEAKAKADAAPPIHVPAPPPLPIPRDIAEKVERLEQRGFHVGAGRTDVPAQPRPTTEGQAPAIKQPEAKPAEAAKTEAKTPEKPADVPPAGKPTEVRGQTAELDDILKRIDAVLSESSAPMSEATLPGQQQAQAGHATLPMPMSPPSEKHERKQTDPNQQKLF